MYTTTKNLGLSLEDIILRLLKFNGEKINQYNYCF